MHDLAPRPLVLPVAVSVDLEEADESPSEPHSDSVSVVLRVMVDSFSFHASSIRVECLSEAEVVVVVEGQSGVARVPSSAKSHARVERDSVRIGDTAI